MSWIRSRGGASFDMLDIKGLSVRYRTARGSMHALRNFDLTVGNERVGIVGESGSGKSTIAKAILGILSQNAEVHADRLQIGDVNVNGGSGLELRQLRGSTVAMIPQDPRHALNPLMRVGRQIGESLLHHGHCGADTVEARVEDWLERVGFSDPKRVALLYPHEISGGMGQRAMIAMMLATEPRLLICDEPTSALDLTVSTQILELLDDLVVDRNLSLLFISHDLRLVSSFCDRVVIMRHGEVVEELRADELWQSTVPYTCELLNAIPQLGEFYAT